MFYNFLDKLKKFGDKTSHIKSIIIVGSYARGENRKDSDIDVVIITKDKPNLIKNQEFIDEFGKVLTKQIEYYRACTSIRVWYENSLEVEFGIVDTSWISIPLDSGTYKVLSDGFKVIIDKNGYFKDLKL